MKQLLKYNWFIGCAAFTQCLATYFMFDQVNRQAILYAFALGFATKSVYSILRQTDVLKHATVRYKVLMMQLPWLVLALVCFFLSGPQFLHWLLVALLLLLTLFYGSHFLLKNKAASLRSSSIGKLAIITLVWVTASVGLPILQKGSLLNERVGLYLALQIFFVAMLTIPFDFYDAEEQKQLGFLTLPSKYGIALTKKICRGLAILCWVCAGFLGLPYLLLMSALVVIYLYFLNRMNETWPLFKYMLYFDGLLIVQALSIILIN